MRNQFGLQRFYALPFFAALALLSAFIFARNAAILGFCAGIKRASILPLPALRAALTDAFHCSQIRL